MKIWLLTTEYPPFFGGGIATYCKHTADMLSGFGHEITVIVNDPSLEEEKSVIVERGIRVIRFKPGGRSIYQYMGYTAALSYEFSEVVEEQIKEDGPPDVIECQEYLGIGYFLLLKKKTLWPSLRDVAIVVTTHSPKFLCDRVDQSPVYRFPDYWIGEMEKFSIRAADLVISPSQYLLNELGRYQDMADVSAYVVANPYVLASGGLLNKDGALNSQSPRIVYVGRLEYRKGVLQMVTYLQSVWQDGLEVPLTMIGGDTFFPPKDMYLGEYLKRKFRRYYDRGLINYVGKVPPEQVAAYLNEATVIVIPSLFENFPYTVVESMAHGRITLASTSGGQSELIENGRSGFLFSHSEPETFRNGLLQALELAGPEALNIGAAAQQRVRDVCGYDAVYSKKIQLYEQVVKAQHPSRIFPFVRSIPKQSGHESGGSTTAATQPKMLSVVIPYYNMGEYLEETLRCLTRVTYKNVEILIVDDGSDDPVSVARLYEVEKRYELRIIHTTNHGLATARNVGAKHAKGEYLAFLDADDLVEPGYYERAIQILETYDNVSFVGCWTQYFSGSTAIWPTWLPEPPYLLLHNPITSGAVVLKREDFLSYGLNDPEMEYGMEDYEFVIRMVEHGCRGAVIPEPLFKYRVRKNSMSRGFNVANQLYLYQLITEKHKEFYKENAVELFNLLNANGPAYLYDNPTWDHPPVGYVGSEGDSQELSVMSSLEIPPEVKQKLVLLWRRPGFRRAVQWFFKLRLHKLF